MYKKEIKVGDIIYYVSGDNEYLTLGKGYEVISMSLIEIRIKDDDYDLYNINQWEYDSFTKEGTTNKKALILISINQLAEEYNKISDIKINIVEDQQVEYWVSSSD